MEIHIGWSTEDVLQRAKDNDVKLTEDEANSILLEMQRDYDACRCKRLLILTEHEMRQT
jgi:hypothetical protein